MMASNSACRPVSIDGIEVWLAGLGGSVDGSGFNNFPQPASITLTSFDIDQIILGQGLSSDRICPIVL